MTVSDQTTDNAVLFSSLNLHPKLEQAIRDLKFERCTPIQGQTLPHTLQGVDLIGQAQTGTGKTAAFLITILQRLVSNPIPTEERFSSEPRALVVAPTRELALQIEKDACELAKHLKLNIISVIGGTQLDRQRRKLRDEAVDLLIATPGRLLDHLTSADIYLDQVEVLVLDEADRMLDMGFIPDVKRIVRATPRERQTLLFSATFSEDIKNLARRWTEDPVEVMLAVDHLPAKTVDQRVYMVESSAKRKLLVNLLKDSETRRVIVFCNRRDETRSLSEALNRHSIKNELISGELPQQKRLKTLERFRKGDFRVLVATDVAGRGLHIDGVTHVVNYNLPDDPEDYVHRIGRTGRAGATGVSISFACEDDSFLIPELEKYLGHELALIHPDDDLLQ
ncbi:DEAD/DEAH box helicase [Hahella aquimaris]|uniref:DEAD/DEAH box helicase n=1 Tax=Hahella sp. HNIBRBA332 TaxID=3015983 RepID=UPI00273B1643|nr:DEAD/DEAH box helicase [Hahella sp. HNIBRBA332]WLQ15327.1 DEAD/DEAH box helicase [Hahella sp. HNIBRBA332]